MKKILTVSFCALLLLIGLACNNQGETNDANLQPLKAGDLPMVSDDIDDSGNNPFHRLPHFFLNDFTSHSATLAYDELCGMKYYPESRIMVFVTGPKNNGSTLYDKLVSAERRAPVTDNLIFAWIHIREDNTVHFVKKVYAKNLKKRKNKEVLVL